MLANPVCRQAASVPPKTGTPSAVGTARWQERPHGRGGPGRHTPVVPSWISVLARLYGRQRASSAARPASPPIARTDPSGRGTAWCTARAACSEPVGSQAPLPGSYTSHRPSAWFASCRAVLTRPPTARTRPPGGGTVTWSQRATVMAPAGSQASCTVVDLGGREGEHAAARTGTPAARHQDAAVAERGDGVHVPLLDQVAGHGPRAGPGSYATESSRDVCRRRACRSGGVEVHTPVAGVEERAEVRRQPTSVLAARDQHAVGAEQGRRRVRLRPAPPPPPPPPPCGAPPPPPAPAPPGP
ncbi:hypothetical protein ADK34_08420, partial [Streptomyces viridochromogenes]